MLSYLYSPEYTIPMNSGNTIDATIRAWVEKKASGHKYIDSGVWPQNKPCSWLYLYKNSLDNLDKIRLLKNTRKLDIKYPPLPMRQGTGFNPHRMQIFPSLPSISLYFFSYLHRYRTKVLH